MEKYDKEQIDVLYQFYTSPNVEKQWAEVAKTEGITDSAEFNILKKVAQNSSLEEFGHFLNTNETPVLQLSATELEALRGGISVKTIAKLAKAVCRNFFGHELNYGG